MPSPRPGLWGACEPTVWARRDVFEDGEVREELEALEDHADLAAYGVDVLDVVVEVDAVDDDPTRLGLSRWLMQRIRVDLPEPEGPQTTIFSPLPTARLTSFRTWNWPYHLLTRSSWIMAAPFSVVMARSFLSADGRC